MGATGSRDPLGRRLRRGALAARFTALAVVGEGPLFLFDYALRLARVLVLLSIWRLLFGSAGEVGGLTLAAVLTYTLVAEAFGDLLSLRTGIDAELWQGTIARRYLRPMGIAEQYAGELAGQWALGLLLFALPLLLVAPLLGVDPRPANPAAVPLFVVSLLLGGSVGLALDMIFGALTVALEQPPFTMGLIRTAAASVLSGAMLPLPLLPWGLGDLFAWLPFAATAAAPLQIYTGVGQPALLLGSQVLWALLLWPLVGRLWRAQRERLALYGG